MTDFNATTSRRRTAFVTLALCAALFVAAPVAAAPGDVAVAWNVADLVDWLGGLVDWLGGDAPAAADAADDSGLRSIRAPELNQFDPDGCKRLGGDMATPMSFGDAG